MQAIYHGAADSGPEKTQDCLLSNRRLGETLVSDITWKCLVPRVALFLSSQYTGMSPLRSTASCTADLARIPGPWRAARRLQVGGRIQLNGLGADITQEAHSERCTVPPVIPPLACPLVPFSSFPP